MHKNNNDKIEYYQSNRENLKTMFENNLIKKITIEIKDLFFKGDVIHLFFESENCNYQSLLDLIEGDKDDETLLGPLVENSFHIKTISFIDGFLLTPKNEEMKGFENLFIEDIRFFIK